MVMQQLEKVGMVYKVDVYLIIFFGGQKQWVVIVCLLVMLLEVIFFDELILVLDLELVNEVLGVMKVFVVEGYIMVVVIYEMDFVCQVFNEVVFLEKGLLIEKVLLEKFFIQFDFECVRQFL